MENQVENWTNKQELEIFIEHLMAQSFEGWSEEAINGYTTAMSTILSKPVLPKQSKNNERNNNG